MMAAISRPVASTNSSGTPNSSQMIRMGSGCASSALTSTTWPSAPAASSASSSSAVIASTRARIISVRRRVKLGATSLRRRAWSPPYVESMLTTPTQPNIQPHEGCSPSSGHNLQCSRGSLLTRGSRISSFRVS